MPTLELRLKSLLANTSKSQLAKQLGIPLMTLKGLLEGHEPRESTVLKIAKALGKSPQEIRYGD